MRQKTGLSHDDGCKISKNIQKFRAEMGAAHHLRRFSACRVGAGPGRAADVTAHGAPGAGQARASRRKSRWRVSRFSATVSSLVIWVMPVNGRKVCG